MTVETTSEDKASDAKKERTWSQVVGRPLFVRLICSILGSGDADTYASPPPAAPDSDVQVSGKEHDDELATEPIGLVTPEIIFSIEQQEVALSSEIADETHMGLPRDITVALATKSISCRRHLWPMAISPPT